MEQLQLQQEQEEQNHLHKEKKEQDKYIVQEKVSNVLTSKLLDDHFYQLKVQ